MTLEAEVEGMQWRRGPHQETQQLLEAGKATGVGSSQSFQKEYSCAQTTIVAPLDSLWICDLQNRKLMNLCCLKLLSLGFFVTAAIGNPYTTSPPTCTAESSRFSTCKDFSFFKQRHQMSLTHFWEGLCCALGL